MYVFKSPYFIITFELLISESRKCISIFSPISFKVRLPYRQARIRYHAIANINMYSRSTYILFAYTSTTIYYY